MTKTDKVGSQIPSSRVKNGIPGLDTLLDGGFSGRTSNQIESRGQSARLDVRASAFEACEVHDYGK